MMNRSWVAQGVALCVLATALPLLPGCGSETVETVVEERDGAEIMAVVAGVKTTLQNDDQTGFEALFTSPSVAKPAWKRLTNMKWNDGEFKVDQLTSFPEIERATANVHVKKLTVQFWFDLNPSSGKGGEIYETTWNLVRSTEGWKLSGLRVTKAFTSYGDLVRELGRMDQFSFKSLNMDWEDYGDPSALLVRALEAMERDDVAALRLCTVDGTLFRAFEKSIEMPTVSNGNTPSGRSNREQSAKYLEDQVKGLQKASEMLGMTVNDLAPLITAYKINRMPSKCTKIRLLIGYDGESANADVTSFDVGWTAAYVMHKWLAEYVGVEAVRGWS
jgi:hypothetical protein